MELTKKFKEHKKYIKLYSATKSSFKTAEQTFNISLPQELSDWYKKYDGGNIFSVHFFSCKDKIDGHKNNLTLQSINSKEFKEEMQIDDEVKLFSQTNYGNYYCFVAGETDGSVYEWECEDCALSVRWNSLSELISEIIENGEQDIKDGLI